MEVSEYRWFPAATTLKYLLSEDALILASNLIGVYCPNCAQLG